MRNYFLLVFLMFLISCSSKPYAIISQDLYINSESHDLFVVNHGWHTGLVVPVELGLLDIIKLNDRFSDSQYLEFGWGDKGFYQAQEITTSLTIKAIFWPTDSVMHVVSIPTNPQAYFSNSEVVKLKLSTNELKSLIAFIRSSFYIDSSGTLVELKKGIYGDSQFYKGNGDYYLMNTCNKWTAKGLKSIGMDINPTFKLSASSVMSYLKGINKP